MLTQYEKERINNIVFMENETRKILKQELPKAHEQLKQLLNKKIYKKDGTILKKYKELYTPKEHKEATFLNCRIWLNNTTYSVYLTINLCFRDKNKESCTYWEKTAYILDINNREVKKVYDINEEEFKLIDESQEIEQANKTKEAKETYEKEKDKLFYRIRAELFK